MSSIFPRLDPNLVITTGVEGPTAVRAVEAIKQEIVQKLSQFGVGKQLQAEVIAKLNDGSYIAKIDGTPMRLALPENIQVGQKLLLTLLHLTPRPMFLMDGQNQVALLDPQKKPKSTELFRPSSIGVEEQNSSSSESDATSVTLSKYSSAQTLASGNQQSQSTSIQTTQITSQQMLVPGKDFANQYLGTTSIDNSAQTELSPTGQLINALLQETNNPKDKLGIRASASLLETDTNIIPEKQIAKQIESHLRQSITSSGLFYESHITQWLTGQKSKAEIELEPQAKIALAQENSVLMNKDERNHTALAQIIHQQLDILDQQKFTWLGLLAPNMPMEWDVSKPPKQDTQSDQTEQETQSWQSQLRLQLPHLGNIDIQLQLRNNQLQLAIKGQQQNAIELLQAAYPALQQTLESTGTFIQSFKIKQDEQA
ncbi:flagellar hook-length control protein FliK [Undibacterium amnicola]|uniref:Flagellar hook-length control protein FliK n=1 Tax=Undibacterium amnicola TaxID=1834038 RepID=A0ABR6XL29_9BURK|nr:flagellar hook-length control protein FliK [Undibacterium amnicola]MBC3830224.1 flagellar hook-length control protein FliK [Undibacterium amnicola]